ncbi:MAG: type II secretion system protein GspL [Thalassotalea sp.]
MAETIIIRLGSRYQDTIHWLITTADTEEIIASGELATAEQLTELTEKAASRKVVVLVPASEVALKSLKVPSKSARAMKQVVPYMLEEELAQDVDSLFFAYATVKNVHSDVNCFVAAIDKQLMKLWLTWLADAKITTTVMLPDALTLPLIDDSYSLVSLGDQLIIRQSTWQAMALDLPVWQLLMQQVNKPTKVAHFSPLSVENSLVTLASQPEDLPLFIFAKNVATCPVNLLQGEFLQKQKSNVFWQHWKLAASFAVLAFLVSLTGKFIKLSQLETEQLALETEIHSLYQDNFAVNKGRTVSLNKIKALVKARLRSLDINDEAEKFIPLMNKITPAFIAVNSLKPETLKYDNKRNEIRIQASAKSYQDFERFKTELEKAKLEVSQGSQNNQGNVVTGSFSIKDAS